MGDSSHTDRCVRAMTDDGGLRLVTVSLRETITGAAAAQRIAAPEAEELAELIAGTVLLRETTAPGRRVQVALRDERGTLVADSLPDGITRGLVSRGDGAERRKRRCIEVTYSQNNGAMHKGIVEIADKIDVSAAMMTYLQESEQILTTIAVASSPADAANVVTAAGFVVQLLPELERTSLERVTERLDSMQSLRERIAGGLPGARELVDVVFAGFEYTILADSEIRFGCNCTRERFIAGIGTLAPDEIASMIAANEPLELTCDACGKIYRIAPDDLRSI